jgi:hypothetical protein
MPDRRRLQRRRQRLFAAIVEHLVVAFATAMLRLSTLPLDAPGARDTGSQSAKPTGACWSKASSHSSSSRSLPVVAGGDSGQHLCALTRGEWTRIDVLQPLPDRF